MTLFAVDTCSLTTFLEGQTGSDVSLLLQAMADDVLTIPPAVLAEMLSYTALSEQMSDDIQMIPVLPLLDGYWQRVGRLRRTLIQHGHKAKLGDAMIAQSCIDHQVPLITRDTDFRHFVKHGSLVLAE